MKKTQKLLSMLMAFCLVFALVPQSAQAASHHELTVAITDLQEPSKTVSHTSKIVDNGEMLLGQLMQMYSVNETEIETTFQGSGLSQLVGDCKKAYTDAKNQPTVDAANQIWKTFYDAHISTVSGNEALKKALSDYEVTISALNYGTTTLDYLDRYELSFTLSSVGGGPSKPAVRPAVKPINPDGSKPQISVDPVTGTETAATQANNGSSSIVKTEKNGTVTAEAQVSDKAVKDAAAKGEVVVLPMPEVPAGKTEVAIHVPTGTKTKVEVPVKNMTAGVVAVQVMPDGTEQVIRKSAVGDNGVVVPVESDVTVKIENRAKTFSDVKSTDWCADSVSFVSARGLFNGTSATTFTPNAPMTRGMLAVVLHNLENNPDATVRSAFDDVADTAWNADAIAWASENKIVTGYADGTFGPTNNISRQQLATMLWRYAGCPESTQAMTYSDLDQVSDYAVTALQWATENGIIKGVGNNQLAPQGLATR